MKRINFLVVLILITLLISSCKSSQASDLKFYVISREILQNTITDADIVKKAKNEGRLAFDGEDIMGYHWKTHTVMLNSNAITSIGKVTAESGGSALFKVDDSYAFVLVLNNKLVYTGGFTNGIKNPDVPLQPSIKDKTNTSFSIQFDSKYTNENDKRQNKALYNYLESLGLLSAKTN